jgi:hypothetical protein
MKLPKWLLPIIASVVVMLLSADVAWTWNSNEKTASATARCDYINSSLIDTKCYMNSNFDHVEKRLDKIEDKLDKICQKLDQLSNKK